MIAAENVAALIGRPWSRADWSCWDLVRDVSRHFGRELPLIPGSLADSHSTLVKAFARHPERENWQEGEAEPGAIALMARNDGRRDAEVHAGIYVVFERPFVLHVDRPHGTVLDTLPMLQARGWHKINFYRHR